MLFVQFLAGRHDNTFSQPCAPAFAENLKYRQKLRSNQPLAYGQTFIRSRPRPHAASPPNHTQGRDTHTEPYHRKQRDLYFTCVRKNRIRLCIFPETEVHQPDTFLIRPQTGKRFPRLVTVPRYQLPPVQNRRPQPDSAAPLLRTERIGTPRTLVVLLSFSFYI